MDVQSIINAWTALANTLVAGAAVAGAMAAWSGLSSWKHERRFSDRIRLVEKSVSEFRSASEFVSQIYAASGVLNKELEMNNEMHDSIKLHFLKTMTEAYGGLGDCLIEIRSIRIPLSLCFGHEVSRLPDEFISIVGNPHDLRVDFDDQPELRACKVAKGMRLYQDMEIFNDKAERILRERLDS